MKISRPSDLIHIWIRAKLVAVGINQTARRFNPNRSAVVVLARSPFPSQYYLQLSMTRGLPYIRTWLADLAVRAYFLCPQVTSGSLLPPESTKTLRNNRNRHPDHPDQCSHHSIHNHIFPL